MYAAQTSLYRPLRGSGPTIRADFPGFTSKSVEHSRYLPPITQGFSRPLPTIALIVLFVAGIGLLARIIATGVPLSILLPGVCGCRPARGPAVGVTFDGEPASLLRVALLIVACGLIGVASIIR